MSMSDSAWDSMGERYDRADNCPRCTRDWTDCECRDDDEEEGEES